MTLTIDKMLAAMREMKAMEPVRPRLRIEYSHMALKETTERLFPESKNRSKRILKKLLKRHGGMYRKQPVMIRLGDTIYAHPSFRSQLEAQFKKETNDVQMHANPQNPLVRSTWL